MADNATTPPTQEKFVEQKVFKSPSKGDYVRVMAIATKMYLNYKKGPADGSGMQKPDPQDIKLLEEVGAKIGFNVNIWDYAGELMDGLGALEDDLARTKPEVAAKKFYEKCPNISHILAIDPNGGWKSIKHFLPNSDEQKERRAWVKQVFAAVCSYVNYLKKTGKIDPLKTLTNPQFANPGQSILNDA